MVPLSKDHKVFIGIGLATVLIIAGGIFLVSNQDERLNKPLLGQEVAISGRNHLPQGTQITYNSNPPTGGPHYSDPAHAGIYEAAPLDGNLVHSLEHGAVILWYNPKLLSKDQIEQVKQVFNQLGGKSIMVPRESMDSPIALTSWGRILKINTIDTKQINAFFDTNNNRGPEQAPI